MPWQPPSLQLKWGPYFKPDVEDQQKQVDLVQKALGSGGTGEQLITLQHAVEKLAPIFGIENVAAAIKSLEEERQKKADEGLEKKVEEADELGKVEAKHAPPPAKPPAFGK